MIKYEIKYEYSIRNYVLLISNLPMKSSILHYALA